MKEDSTTPRSDAIDEQDLEYHEYYRLFRTLARELEVELRKYTEEPYQGAWDARSNY